MSQTAKVRPTCYGIDHSHEPTEMKEHGNDMNQTQFICPSCNVIIGSLI